MTYKYPTSINQYVKQRSIPTRREENNGNTTSCDNGNDILVCSYKMLCYLRSLGVFILLRVYFFSTLFYIFSLVLVC